jgi:RNA polymerase primary sigma factor
MHEKICTEDSRSEDSDLVRIYLQDIGDSKPISREEEVDLFKQVRDGDDEAVQKLVRANLRFVVTVAREFMGRGLPLIDLIAEGNMGLLEAVRRFDVTRGFKFITYAVWWIRQAIFQALMHSARSVRLPASRFSDRQKIDHTIQELRQELGRDPTLDEVGDATALSEERVQKAMEAARRDLSLETPFFRDGDEAMGDYLAADGMEPAEELEKAELDAIVRQSMEVLEAREYQIIRSYFGLEGGKPVTLEQIGDRMGLTRERIRQLRDRALAKMRQARGDQLLELSRN